MNRIVCLVMLMFAAFAPLASAQTVITPSAATATSELNSSYDIGNTIDGSGLTATGAVSTWTHALNGVIANQLYLSASSSTLSTNVLTFTLPSASTVGTMYLWQYDANNSWNNRGLNTFNLSFSTDNGATYPTTITGLAAARESDSDANTQIAVQTITFATQTGVTHIKITNPTNFGDIYLGFGEIRFGEPVGLLAPRFVNLKAQTITETSADLVGQLVDGAADVSVFWDTVNRGQNFTWAHTNSPVDAYTNTAVLTIITNSISGLTPGQTNYFAFYASNATDTAWAFSSFVSTPQTEVITPYQATASSTHDAIRIIEKTINGSGLATNGDVSTWTHDNMDNTYWMATVASNAVLTYSLPGVADVDGVYIWQGAYSSFPNRSLNTFAISFSTDNGVSFANTVSGLSLVKGTNITQTCTFPRKSGVTHIRLSNLTSSDTTYVNLGEIRFRRAGPPAGTIIIVR